jgi:hypothetical protein
MADKMTARELLSHSKRVGVHRIGAGLYLRVVLPGATRRNGKPKPAGCSWAFRYMLDGRGREMGLGPYPVVTLERAREKAMDAHRLKGGWQESH